MKSWETARADLQSLTLHRLPWALLAVAGFVFLAPNVDFAGQLAWHDGQRLAQLALLAVVLLALVAPDAARRAAGVWASLPRWIRIALLTAFALGFASSLVAPLPRWGLLDWGLLLLLLTLALCVAANRQAFGDRLDQPIVLLFFATATAYAVSVCTVYGTMLLAGPAYGQGFNVRELYTGFSNIRFFGHVQTMLLPFLLLPALWWGTTRARRVMLWSIPAIWWMLVVGSGTRGTWVALLVGIVAVAMYGGRIGRQWIKWQFAGLLCGLLCYAVFILLVPQLLEQPVSFLHRAEDIVSLSQREVLWATSIGFAAQHPLLGIGPMHYAYFATEVAAHPHNAVLQWLAEWGVSVALLFTAVAAAGGLAFARRVKRTVDDRNTRLGLVSVALLAALTGAAAQAMVDGIIVMPVSQTLLALLSGWAMGMHYFPHGAKAARCSRGEYALAAAFVMMAAAAVFFGAAPEIGHIAEREKAYLAAHPTDARLLPRFWAQGWIND